MAGFDFGSHMVTLCGDIAARVEPLSHIRMENVAVSVAQTRSAAKHGMWASLTPLRFKNGATKTMRRGRCYKLPRIVQPNGEEALYILTFYLPRFLTLSFKDRITTVCHELWHIGPAFDGDIRRFPGRCYAHSGNHGEFDAQAEALAKAYLTQRPPESIYTFCRLDFAEIEQQHGRVFGLRYPQPRLILAPE
jgi:Putative phage metallopeptidase